MHAHLQVVDERETGQLRELLAGVVRGERTAIGAFFDLHEHTVNRLVWRVLGADADHDDVVNEVFEVLIRRAGDVENPAALSGWVRTVTLNALRATLRRRRWRQLFVSTSDEALQHPDLSVPDEADRERTRGLYRALNKLSFDDRTVLVLRHLEGLELTEVAASLGCSLATVKRWLPRAERRLATHLGGAA